MNKIKYPEERRESFEVSEHLEELKLISPHGFKSKHDDCIDTISMLASLKPWKPSGEIEMKQADDGIWELDYEESDTSALQSYLV